MITKPTDKELLALARLSRLDDGKVLLAYLTRTLEDVKDKLVSAESDSTIRRLQGRADALKELAEALELAPDLIVKLENRARSR